MKKQPKPTIKTPDLSSLSAAELRLMVAQFQAVVEEQNASLLEHKSELKAAHRRIELLEEMNRLLKTQKFSASSEKSKFQLNLFDETELEAQLDELFDTLPEASDENVELTQARKARQTRQRGFSANLHQSKRRAALHSCAA